MFSGVCEAKFSKSSENRKISVGSVVRSRIVSGRGPAAYRGKALIFGLANPRLRYQGFCVERSAVPNNSRAPRLRLTEFYFPRLTTRDSAVEFALYPVIPGRRA